MSAIDTSPPEKQLWAVLLPKSGQKCSWHDFLSDYHAMVFQKCSVLTSRGGRWHGGFAGKLKRETMEVASLFCRRRLEEFSGTPHGGRF
jgi:hypothetical protein